MLAGPKLTPTSFRDGQFSLPGSGGAFQDQVTTHGNKVGDVGVGYPEYSLLGPKDFALVWYDPKAEGLGNILGNKQTGNYWYLDGGKRYTLDRRGRRASRSSSRKQPTDVDQLHRPARRRTFRRQYPCDGCPSQGGAQVPASTA